MSRAWLSGGLAAILAFSGLHELAASRNGEAMGLMQEVHRMFGAAYARLGHCKDELDRVYLGLVEERARRDATRLFSLTRQLGRIREEAMEARAEIVRRYEQVAPLRANLEERFPEVIPETRAMFAQYEDLHERAEGLYLHVQDGIATLRSELGELASGRHDGVTRDQMLSAVYRSYHGLEEPVRMPQGTPGQPAPEMGIARGIGAMPPGSPDSAGTGEDRTRGELERLILEMGAPVAGAELRPSPPHRRRPDDLAAGAPHGR